MPDIRNYILVDKDGTETQLDIVSKVDTSLTQENIPADSKTVGDKLTEIDTKIEQLEVEGNKEIFNFPTHFDFPSTGSVDCIYKAYNEKKTYQWNEELLKYEPLNEVEQIKIINGGTADGTID